MKILIVGPSGSGKSYISRKLKEKGINAVDADSLDQLHGWFNWKKEKVKFPEDAGSNFLNNHEFVWDRKYLKQFLKETPNVYLFGLSNNVLKMKDLFDKSYYLFIPKEELEQRLQNNDRENPMGKTEYQRKVILKSKNKSDRLAKKAGLEFIDATLTPEEIFKKISK